MEFGLRTVWEMTRYAYFATVLAAEPDADRLALVRESLDIQILQKVLPRIHGSRRRVEACLRSLYAYCTVARVWSDAGIEDSDAFVNTTTAASLSTVPIEPVIAENAFYKRSANKLHRMLLRTVRDGLLTLPRLKQNVDCSSREFTIRR